MKHFPFLAASIVLGMVLSQVAPEPISRDAFKKKHGHDMETHELYYDALVARTSTSVNVAK